MIHPADQSDTKTIATTLEDAQAKLCAIRGKEEAPSIDEPFDLVADKGYHSREVLKDLPASCRSRISEPKHKGQLLQVNCNARLKTIAKAFACN